MTPTTPLALGGLLLLLLTSFVAANMYDVVNTKMNPPQSCKNGCAAWDTLKNITNIWAQGVCLLWVIHY